MAEVGPSGKEVLQYPGDFLRWAEQMDAYLDAIGQMTYATGWDAEIKKDIRWLRHMPKHRNFAGTKQAFVTPVFEEGRCIGAKWPIRDKSVAVVEVHIV